MEIKICKINSNYENIAKKHFSKYVDDPHFNSLKNKMEQKVVSRLLLDGAEIQEVAAECNLSVDYVYTVKSRAVAHLREILKAYKS